jgi:hypothetical protein
MNIGVIFDLGGNKCNCIMNLNIGDRLVAKHTNRNFIKDQIYVVKHITIWDFTRVAYVACEDGSLTFATSDLFDYPKDYIRDQKIDKILEL